MLCETTCVRPGTCVTASLHFLFNALAQDRYQYLLPISPVQRP